MKTLAFIFSTIILTGTVFASGQIDIAYSPYTISKPGSYIVVKDLTTPSGANCITIQTSDVTINLNGHTLYGETTGGSSFAGIYSDAGDNITITNGAIRNFNSYGIYLGAAQAHISKVKIVGKGVDDTGIRVDGGIIENNLVSNINVYGIYCLNNLYPAVIANNVVSNVSGAYWAGIAGFANCDIKGNNLTNIASDGIDIQNGKSKITGNSMDSCYSHGIWLLGGQNCTITGNNITNTINGNGISASINGCNIIGNTVANNSTDGINAGSGCKVSDNVVYSNGIAGISASNGCTLTGNNIYANGSNGINVGSGSLVQGNTFRDNGNYGLSANGGNHIEANNFSSNTVGMYVSGSNNTILNNSLWTNSTGLWLSGGHNFFAGNSLRGNTSVDTAISANNTAGNGTTGFVNIVIP